MNAIVEQTLQIPGGGIVYDASLSRKPQPAWFSRQYWSGRDSLTEVAGGRGSVCFLRTDAGNWVLRHYRRGGFMARLSRDRYVWLGESRTRSFAEWRLLAELRRRGLPVPAPVAAHYARTGLTYRADLITAQLPPSQTLADMLGNTLGADQWRAVGRTLARFHEQGVHHADLNANNILLGADGAIYLLDFDRGRIRARGAWEQQVLARLRRSLEKITRQRGGTAFSERDWSWLVEGYGGEADSG